VSLHYPGSRHAAPPEHNRDRWEDDIWPKAQAEVPEGHILVRLANAHQTSAGYAGPGDMQALPADEARELLRQGYARRVQVS
jgi:hypothetical protein